MQRAKPAEQETRKGQVMDELRAVRSGLGWQAVTLAFSAALASVVPFLSGQGRVDQGETVRPDLLVNTALAVLLLAALVQVEVLRRRVLRS